MPKINISVHEISISTKENSAGVTLKEEYFDRKNGEVRFVALLLANSSDPGGEAKNYSRNDNWPITSDDDHMEMKTIMKNPFECKNYYYFKLNKFHHACPVGFLFFSPLK